MGETQGLLFGGNVYGGTEPVEPVRSANGDPPTSHEAAERVAKSGKVHRHRGIACRLVAEHPDKTGYELWLLASAEEQLDLGNVHELYRRLADGKNAKKLRQGAPRKCSVKGTSMVTWEPA